jgi:hypothetical protein
MPACVIQVDAFSPPLPRVLPVAWRLTPLLTLGLSVPEPPPRPAPPRVLPVAWRLTPLLTPGLSVPEPPPRPAPPARFR